MEISGSDGFYGSRRLLTFLNCSCNNRYKTGLKKTGFNVFENFFRVNLFFKNPT